MKRSANTQWTSGLAKSTAQRPTFCWAAKNSRTYPVGQCNSWCCLPIGNYVFHNFVTADGLM